MIAPFTYHMRKFAIITSIAHPAFIFMARVLRQLMIKWAIISFQTRTSRKMFAGLSKRKGIKKHDTNKNPEERTHMKFDKVN